MRILSFDIGTDMVKALELDVSFGRLELADYLMEHVIEPPQSLKPAESEQQPVEPVRKILTDGQLVALRRILAERPFRYDKLVVNVPKSMFTGRLLSFPTKDRKTIQKSLAFELDDEIPLDLADVVYDFALLEIQPTQSMVFTAIALKKDVGALLTELGSVGLDPDLVTVDTWALSQLIKRALPAEYTGQPVCVINAGFSQTSVHIFSGDKPVITHHIPLAGRHLTQAIATSYGLSFDQAEKAKKEGAFLITQTHLSNAQSSDSLTKEQKQFAQVLSDALIPMVREIKQTLMSFKGQYHVAPKAIFLTGGTSLIPSLTLYLEEILQIPVYNLTYATQLMGQTLQLSESTEALFAPAMGLALSLVKPDRNNLINFRKEDFAKQGGFGAFSLKAYRKPLKYVALSLVFVYANLFIQYLILSSRSEKQDAAFERAVKSVLGSASRSTIAMYRNSSTTLKNAVTREISKYKTTVTEPKKKQISALDMLHKVSKAMPRDVMLDVSQMALKDGKFLMKGIATQITDTDRIQKALEETKVFTDISKTTPEEDPKTKKIKFGFSAKLAESK